MLSGARCDDGLLGSDWDRFLNDGTAQWCVMRYCVLSLLMTLSMLIVFRVCSECVQSAESALRECCVHLTLRLLLRHAHTLGN